MSSNETYFEVRSVERSNVAADAPVLKAGDGSLCFFTVVNCSDVNAKLELCAVCSSKLVIGSPHCSIVSLAITKGSQFRLGLGQAPDLAPLLPLSAVQRKQHLTFRSLLEFALRGSRPHEQIAIHYSLSKPPVDDQSESNFHLSIRVDDILHPPRCINRGALPSVRCSDEGTSAFTGGTKDPLENPTNDWNPELATHWSLRAWALKVRGTWLVNKHIGRRQEPLLEGDFQSKLIRHIWSSGFACYSRSLQLATLARSARERCASEVHSDENYEHPLNQPIPPTLLDSDQLPDSGKEVFDLSTQALSRLEFSLLLNLALCHLRVGVADFAAVNCSEALALKPDWANAAGDAICKTAGVQKLNRSSTTITNSDVAKALYRRAQAHMRTGKAEEAKSDAQCAARLYALTNSQDGNKAGQSNSSSTAIAACEALISQATERIAKDKDILIERIRKRRNEL